MMHKFGEDWKPLKGYEGHYWINQQSQICNAKGHVLKATQQGTDQVFELRKNGQRDRVVISSDGKVMVFTSVLNDKEGI